MFDRSIGRVVSVDSFRVIIELEKDIKTLYKSGYQDIYEIARINSYVILPVGSDKIIALITKVKINDETEIEGSTGVISLPKARRYIIATMIGTIVGKVFSQGVYNFPILDNPVWYVMKEDLELIFDQKTKEEDIDFKKDYFLPIGTSTAFAGFDIKINPDKFFGKHAAVLGNTGSGKSCTISTILQSILKGKFKNNGREASVTNAHIIIFDTNGEYKSAFQFTEPEVNQRVNAFTIGKEGLKVPYWFMNYDDFDYLFKPSEQTQAPILKRAIAMAKSVSNTDEFEEKILHDVYLTKLMWFNNQLHGNDNEMKRAVLNDLDDLIASLELNANEYIEEIYLQLVNLQSARTAGKLNGEYALKGTVDSATVARTFDVIEKNLAIIMTQEKRKIVSNEKDVDIPGYFSYKNLMSEFLDNAIDEIGSSQSKYKEYLSSLKLRLSSYYSDERVNIPFMLKEDYVPQALSSFLKYITGVLNEVVTTEKLSSVDPENTVARVAPKSNPFCEYRCKNIDEKYVNVPDAKNISQVTIIDMSLLPYEVLENITGLIGRLLIDFLQRIEKVTEYKEKRGSFPIVLVLEEAQNYIPEINRNKDRISISKRIFERIAREGRKFGISLLISSQRPSELSKTILSQCNTFIVHRLQNPEDQRYIRQLVSSANEDILNQLPVIPQQHAIIMGDAVRSPVQVRMFNTNPKPDSDDPKIFDNWINGRVDEIDFSKVVDNWIGKTE